MIICINKRRGAGFTLTELVFVVAIITLFIVLLTPFITKVKTEAKIISCEENLQNIGLGLKLYAKEHDGAFPPKLGDLLEGGYVGSEKVFDCPSTSALGTREEPEYHYTTGYTVLSPSDSMIVFDKDGNHKGGTHVLYVSGDIAWE